MALREEYVATLDTIPGLGQKNYSDQAPEGAVLPYTVTLFDISEVPVLRGDGKTLAVTRLSQTDLWEARDAEDEVLRKAIWATLDGIELLDTFKLMVRSVIRVPDPNYNLTHRAFTVAATQRLP